MGRISKRKMLNQQPEKKDGVLRIQAGIYARLSSDQDVKKNGSVEIQIEIAKKFVEEFNRQEIEEEIEVVEYYIDLGKTGSNFEREHFLRLLQDIKLGKINCVIVKDLSRFGRNYLEAGNYIEKIFPFLGVRFIAVADGFDTGKEGNGNKQMGSEIKNLVNDMYAKEFSKKAKLHLKQRREEGSYVGGVPPYGYKAKWNGKRRVLLPDENTKCIVRFIYEKFVEMQNYTMVAKELNDRCINPPYLYKKTKEVYYVADNVKDKGWDKSAVERILKSETYIGNLVQGKTSITARNEKNRIHNPKDKWLIIKGTHEPIIEKELYKKAEEIRQKIKERTTTYKHHTKNYSIEENILSNILYCGVCGRKMTRNSYVKQYAGGEKARMGKYFCLNSRQTKAIGCSKSNYISKNELLDILLPLIHIEFEVLLNRPEHYITYGKRRIAETAKRTEESIRETERKIRRFHEEESNAYIDYSTGKILQENYVSFKKGQEERWNELNKQKQRWEREKKELDKQGIKYLTSIKTLVKPRCAKDITKDMLEAFISKIYIYPGKRMEVLFTVTFGMIRGVDNE